jgi:hypothetical protein
MKKIKLLAAIMSVVMMMTVLAIFPSAAAPVAKQEWKLDPATFATKTTDGPFTYGYVECNADNNPDWGTLMTGALKPVAMNAANDAITTADASVTLFRKVNGAMCMTIKQGWATAIRFTAPEDGTYTFTADIHKWGSGGSAECGFISSDWEWTNKVNGDNGVFTANDSRRAYSRTVTVSAGFTCTLYVRGWADGNITINSFNVTKEGTKEKLDWNNALNTEDNISIFSTTNVDGKPDFANKVEFTASTAASPSGNTGTNGSGSTDAQQIYTLSNGATILEGLAKTYTLIYYKAPACGTYTTMFSGHTWSACGYINVYYYYGNETDGFTQLMNGENAIRDDFWEDNKRYDKSRSMTVEAGDYIVIAVWTGGNGVALTMNEISFSCAALEHKGNEGWNYNDNNHWTEYDCCGEKASDEEAHDFSNGNCACGKAAPAVTPDPTPDPEPTPNPNPSTADTAISIATVIAVAGILGFAIATKKR